jgi:hypothetical protein
MTRAEFIAETIMATDREVRLERALLGLMRAHERRVRSLCENQEQIERAPWRCAEFVEAEMVLNEDHA